jgi:hypothetical protein
MTAASGTMLIHSKPVSSCCKDIEGYGIGEEAKQSTHKETQMMHIPF